MFAWPRLPSISLPATIQRRLLSFVLTRSFGHFFRPGQLDSAQIEAQIGNGFVHLGALELDHDNINQHLKDLPVPLRLEAGSIGKVSARISWPNPLVAPLALSVSSIDLNFAIVAQAHTPIQLSRLKDELVESIASIADSFTHDELSEMEKQTLQESVRLEFQARQHQPSGSSKPFSEDSGAAPPAEAYDQSDGADPSSQGTPILAPVIEHLLANSDFNASDVTLRLVLPHEAEFILRVKQAVYGTESGSDTVDSPAARGLGEGEVRIAKVAGVSISIRDLTPPSSSSTPSLSPSLSIEERERTEERILSLGLGSEPMVFRLVVPPPIVLQSAQGHESARPGFQSSLTKNIRLTITAGPVAIALNSIHARSLHHLSSALVASRPTISTLQNFLAYPLDVTLHTKSITLLLLLPPSQRMASQPTTADPLQHFFLTDSAQSSSLRVPHIRLQLDALDISHSSLQTASTVTHLSNASDTSQYLIKASLADLSAFAFFATDESWSAFPILVSDPNLGTQYDHDVKLPVFNVVDWTRGGPTDVSYWRVRPPHTNGRSSSAVPEATASSSVPHAPVMRACMESGAVCEVDLLPLHVLVDVRVVEGAVDFLRSAKASLTCSKETGDPNPDLDLTPEGTMRAGDYAAWNQDETKTERKSLNTQVIDDLTKLDVGTFAPFADWTNFVIRISLIRFQVRAPPPPDSTAPLRSGALVLDLFGVQVTHRDEEPGPSRRTAPKLLGMMEFERLIAASTLPGESKAISFIYVVAQTSTTETPSSVLASNPPTQAYLPVVTPLPSVCLRSNPVSPHRPPTVTFPGAASSYYLDVHLPLVQGNISQPALDGLVLWVDDITEGILSDDDSATASDASEGSQDLGSIKIKPYALRAASTDEEGRKSDLLVKVYIGEAKIRVLVDDAGTTRPLDVTTSDFDFFAGFTLDDAKVLKIHAIFKT